MHYSEVNFFMYCFNILNGFEFKESNNDNLTNTYFSKNVLIRLWIQVHYKTIF